MKIKFFKKEKSFKKEKASSWLDLNFYWKLAVGFMFVVVLLAFAFGYYLFIKINKEPVLEATGDSSKAETAKKDRIDKVLQYFSARSEKSTKILNSPAPVVDPSL